MVRKRLSHPLISVTAFVVVSHAIAVGRTDWPNYQGPHFDGTSSETGLLRSLGDAPTVQWSKDIGPGFGGSAVRDGEVYMLDRILGEKDVLRCFDLDSGDELWHFEYDVPGRLNFAGSRGTPTVEEDLVYTIGGFGHVYCIDRQTHEEVWSLNYEEEFGANRPRYGWAQSPLVIDYLVIVAPMSGGAGLVALDRFTGMEIWRTEEFGTSHSTPILVELGGQPQIIHITSYADLYLDETGDTVEGFVLAFDPEDGSLLWKYSDYDCLLPIPAPTPIGDNRLFITGGYEAGSVMLEVDHDGDAFSVNALFRNTRGAQIHQPILVNEHLFSLVNGNSTEPRLSRAEGGLQCLDPEGNERWRTGDQPYFGRGSMIFADGMLIIQDGHSGVLSLVEPSPDEFRLIAEVPAFPEETRRDGRMWGPMALSDGRLLMRSQDQLKCIDMRSK